MPSALQRPHVLIVSDDRDLSDFLGEGLIYAGFWTSTIANAFQALEVFRLRSFDIMLIDGALGGIGALELVRRLRGRSAGSPETARTEIPILLVADDDADAVAYQSAGADEVIVAPIELADLAVVLSQSVAAWRAGHPGHAWADEAALADLS